MAGGNIQRHLEMLWPYLRCPYRRHYTSRDLLEVKGLRLIQGSTRWSIFSYAKILTLQGYIFQHPHQNARPLCIHLSTQSRVHLHSMDMVHKVWFLIILPLVGHRKLNRICIWYIPTNDLKLNTWNIFNSYNVFRSIMAMLDLWGLRDKLYLIKRSNFSKYSSWLFTFDVH